MRTLYFTQKDLDLRLRGWRQQFWRQVEEEQPDIAKKRLEQALGAGFKEAVGADRYERAPGRRKMNRDGYRCRDLQSWGGRLYRAKAPKGEKGCKFKLLQPFNTKVRTLLDMTRSLLLLRRRWCVATLWM